MRTLLVKNVSKNSKVLNSYFSIKLADIRGYYITGFVVHSADLISHVINQTGILPCFLGGLNSLFLDMESKEEINLCLVSLGSITSSMYPLEAAT
jgi:hypothetical protein